MTEVRLPAAAPARPARPARPRSSGARRAAIRVAVAAVTLAVIAWRLPGAAAALHRSLHQLQHPWWVAAVLAVVAEASSFGLFADMQRRLLRIGGSPLPAGPVLAVTLAGNALSLSLSAAGGLAATGYSVAQYRRRGAPTAVALWTVATSGAVAAIGLLAFADAGLGLAGVLAPVPALVLGALLGVGVPAFWVALHRSPPGRWQRRLSRPAGRLAARTSAWWQRRRGPGAPDPVALARTAIADLRRLRPRPAQWAVLGVEGVLTWVLDAAALAAAYRAYAPQLPWRALVVAYLVAQVGVLIKLTPGGLGIVEGGVAGVLVGAHAAASTAVSATVLYRVVSLWGLLLAGWLAYLLIARSSSRRALRPVRRTAAVRAGRRDLDAPGGQEG